MPDTLPTVAVLGTGVLANEAIDDDLDNPSFSLAATYRVSHRAASG
ncbi:hypothetical protein [Mycobacterium sp. OTB74]|jgi:hypothetical protein|nr:hypothetical protein [Mycobacterium sp. OTB74]MDH6245438.1 hypothetical protein [Mycobacterium sp. OTB74]